MHLKILGGAPVADHLDFSPEALLDPEAAVQLFKLQFDKTTLPGTDSSNSDVKWRRLGPKGERLHTGWSQPYLPSSGAPNFSFSLPNVEGATELPLDNTSFFNTGLDAQASALDGFLEHSLAFHDTLLSSQVMADDGADQTVSSSSFLDEHIFDGSVSFEADLNRLESTSNPPPILKVPPILPLSTLASLPSASYLRSIIPQTPTVNIVCVVTMPPQSKEVLVKRRSFKMTLQELTVADDTRSGFKVTFWIRPSSKDPDQNTLVGTLAQLKVGQILLLRNIALSTFRESVFGQSLNPSIIRARTSVDIVVDDYGVPNCQLSALPTAMSTTIARLARWAKDHVAPNLAQPLRKRRHEHEPDSEIASSRRKPNTQDEMLPPDTMESV